MRADANIQHVISDERLQAYARVPLIERLRWLDELVRFTQMWRAAPESSGMAPLAAEDRSAYTPQR